MKEEKLLLHKELKYLDKLRNALHSAKKLSGKSILSSGLSNRNINVAHDLLLQVYLLLYDVKDDK